MAISSNNSKERVQVGLIPVRIQSYRKEPSHLIQPTVSCNKYLCPSTLTCVNAPIECPCPYPEDIKCIIPDMDKHGLNANGGVTVVCVSGKDGCDVVNKLI